VIPAGWRQGLIVKRRALEEEKDLASGGRSEVGGGRRLSPTFEEWRIQTEEEDLASGGRR
jgi:hypothetical protein